MKKKKNVKRITNHVQLKVRTGVRSGFVPDTDTCYPTDEGLECPPGTHVDKGSHGYCCFPNHVTPGFLPGET